MVKARRYIVFAGANYYPGCGAEDIVLATDNFDLAIDVAKDKVSGRSSGYWGQVYDVAESAIVFFDRG